MSVLMIACFMPSMALAEEPPAFETDWVSSLGEATTAPEGYIEKEKGNSVTIYTAEGLAWFAKQVNSGNNYSGKYVSLASDIDLDGKAWVPIGNGTRDSSVEEANQKYYFSGTFDGGGHTISNLNVSLTGDGSDDHGAGLFGAVQDATIKNVNIASGNIYNEEDAAAGVVGILLGESCSVSNCSNAASVSGAAAGGVLSRAYASKNTIVNCTNTGSIEGVGTDAKIGGVLCITLNEADVVRCSNSGNVTIAGTYTGTRSAAGGIVGYCNAGAFVAECENNGTMESNASKWAGGIVGYVTGDSGQIIHCENRGEIEAASSAGGIAGVVTVSFEIKDCNNSGAVTSDSKAGGIAGGLANGIIESCTNNGTVAAATHAGGVSGNLGAKGRIMNCSGGTAAVTARTDGVAGFAGRILGNVSTSTDSQEDLSAHIWIDDNNNDSYADGMKTIGRVAAWTGWGRLIIESGTMVGVPAYTTTNKILLRENAVWEAVTERTENAAVLCNVGNGKGEGSYQINIEKTYSGEKTETLATCTDNGSLTYSGDSYTFETKALGHRYGEGACVEATCGAAGKITYTCSVGGCDAVHEVTLPADGTHAWGTAEIIKDATYSETGLSYSKCTKCEATKVDVISKLRRTSGGSSSSTTTTTDNVTNTTEDKTTNTGSTTETGKVEKTTATVKSETKTNADGTKTVAATVDSATASKIVEKAVENKSEEVVIDTAAASQAGTTAVTETAAGTKTEVALPEQTVKAIAQEIEAAVTIKSDAAEVKLDTEAVKALADQSGDLGTVSLVVETVAQSESKVEVDLKLVTSKGSVTEFKGGSVSVTVKLNTALAAKPVVCVYIDDFGTYHKVSGQKNADGTYTFVTGHFSSYAVMAEEDANKVIAEQTENVEKRVESLSLKARSAKTEKGNIKVTLAVDEDAIKAIEDLGYTVKYKFYRSTKKSKGYTAKYEKAGLTYTNTAGTKGTRYYYKARVMVYNAQGALIAKTELKQCKYACRIR